MLPSGKSVRSVSTVQYSGSVASSSSATPWTAAGQAYLSITNSQNLLKLMYIQSVMPSKHSSSAILFSSRLQSFPASGSFQMSHFFASGDQSIGVSASTSVIPMKFRTSFLWDRLVGSLAVQGTLKSLLQHHSSNSSILRGSAFFIVWLSHQLDRKSVV